MKLRRSQVNGPGLGRRRAGTGFTYLDVDGSPLRHAEQVRRCKELVVPPAWEQVWICPWPDGHIQAVGTDDAGRRQYLYHPDWRARRDRAKHTHVLALARALPAARERVAVDLARRAMPKERALAIAFRLLDLGYFRVGGESYARSNGSYGLATLEKRHVTVSRDGRVWFDYPAKSGQRRRVMIEDEALVAPLSMLRRRRGGGPELLAYQRGRGWYDLTSSDVNAYLKDLLGPDASAKDFRTWHATVLAAVALARVADEARRSGRELSATARKRAVTGVVKEVAAYLGNTPAVCRASYIDPQLLDVFDRGETIPAYLARRAYADLPEDPEVEEVDVPPTTGETVESAVLGLLS